MVPGNLIFKSGRPNDNPRFSRVSRPVILTIPTSVKCEKWLGTPFHVCKSDPPTNENFTIVEKM